MATSAYFNSGKMLQRLHEGPLGSHIDLYSAHLLKEGHCRIPSGPAGMVSRQRPDT